MLMVMEYGIKMKLKLYFWKNWINFMLKEHHKMIF